MQAARLCIHTIHSSAIPILTLPNVYLRGLFRRSPPRNRFEIDVEHSSRTSHAQHPPRATGKTIRHAYLGFTMLSLTPDAARLNNEDKKVNVVLPQQYGALVLVVGPDTPAARAGFRRFDLITEIGGTAIKSAADAQDLVDKAQVPWNMILTNYRPPLLM